MKKGDIVNCWAKVITYYQYKDLYQPYIPNTAKIIHCPEREKFPRKVLYRLNEELPIKCLLIGKTYLATGYAAGGIYNDDPPYLDEEKRHLVWKCIPYSNSDDRNYKPFFALEKDLSPYISNQ